MAKSTAVAAKRSTGVVVSWKDKLKGYAQAAAVVAEESGGGGGGQFIGLRGGQLTYNGAACAGNKLDTVIIDACLEHAYYPGRYDPDRPQPPVCFAFGRSESEMVPHEKSTQPVSATCRECELNKFGSAEQGKGKACKNIVRLALLPATPLTAEALEKAEPAYMKVPVTSVKNFSNYVLKLSATHDLPPFAFVTRISTVPDAKSQFKVTFEDTQLLANDEEIMAVLMQRHDEVAQMIDFPYTVPTEEPAPTPTKKTAARRKF